MLHLHLGLDWRPKNAQRRPLFVSRFTVSPRSTWWLKLSHPKSAGSMCIKQLRRAYAIVAGDVTNTCQRELQSPRRRPAREKQSRLGKSPWRRLGDKHDLL